ncbi:MAG: hypothetical protein ACLFVZ_12265, partial [Actinomycetota bacterium]
MVSSTAALRFPSRYAFRGLAAPLVLLLWVYVSAIAVLLGAEMNAEMERLWPSPGGSLRGAPGGG